MIAYLIFAAPASALISVDRETSKLSALLFLSKAPKNEFKNILGYVPSCWGAAPYHAICFGTRGRLSASSEQSDEAFSDNGVYDVKDNMVQYMSNDGDLGWAGWFSQPSVTCETFVSLDKKLNLVDCTDRNPDRSLFRFSKEDEVRLLNDLKFLRD